jgi:hypothetical protein
LDARQPYRLVLRHSRPRRVYTACAGTAAEIQRAMTDAPETEFAISEATEVPAVLPDQPPRGKRPVPWRGRPRVTDPHSAWLPAWRVQPELREKVLAEARAAGLSYGAFMRATFSGSPGPRARRQPAADAAVLAKLLAQIGKIGSNHNQLAREKNTDGAEPDLDEWRRIEAEIQEMRRALMKALGYAD